MTIVTYLALGILTLVLLAFLSVCSVAAFVILRDAYQRWHTQRLWSRRRADLNRSVARRR
jgi:hypothetical protein